MSGILIDEADDVEVVHVRVQPHKVVRCVEQPYATYLISVTGESGLEWETERRWNDLRVLEESLQRSDGETLRTHAGSLPHFDAHGNLLVSLFVNKFDPSFLKERAEQMQALLNGWARVLKVRLDAPATGPADMLEFLSAGRPGEASTPRTPATLPPLKGFYDGDSSSGNKPKAKVGSSSPQPVRVLFDALDEEATEAATGQVSAEQVLAASAVSSAAIIAALADAEAAMEAEAKGAEAKEAEAKEAEAKEEARAAAAAEAKAAAAADGSYIAAETFEGAQEGYVFTTRDHGTGYYRNSREVEPETCKISSEISRDVEPETSEMHATPSEEVVMMATPDAKAKSAELQEAEEAEEAEEEAEAAKEAAAVKEVEGEERQEEARAAAYQQSQLLQPAEAAPTSKAQAKLNSLEAELQAELSRVGSPHEEPRSARIPRQQPGVGYYAFRNFLVFLFVFLLPSLVAFMKQKLISRTDGRVVEADFPAVDLLNLKF